MQHHGVYAIGVEDFCRVSGGVDFEVHVSKRFGDGDHACFAFSVAADTDEYATVFGWNVKFCRLQRFAKRV